MKYEKDIAWFTDADSATLGDRHNGKTVSIAGVPFKIIPKTTKKGDKMALMTLEDLQGTVEVTVWPETYQKSLEILEQDGPILVKGVVESDDNWPKVIASEIVPLAEAKEHWKGKVHIRIRTPGLEKATLHSVKEVLSKHPGSNQTLVHFIFPDGQAQVRTVETDLKVKPCDEIIEQIEDLLGENSINFE